MRTNDPSSPSFAGSGSGAHSVLDAFVLYENIATGLSAKYLLENLTSELGLELDLSEKLWKYDAVQDPVLKTEALSQVESSDVVLVSANAGGEPPTEVKSWLHEWIDHRAAKPCALMFWFDSRNSGDTDEVAADAARYWRELAHAGNLEFYSNLDVGEVAFENPARFKGMSSAEAACALMARCSGRDSLQPRHPAED